MPAGAHLSTANWPVVVSTSPGISFLTRLARKPANASEGMPCVALRMASMLPLKPNFSPITSKAANAPARPAACCGSSPRDLPSLYSCPNDCAAMLPMLSSWEGMKLPVARACSH